MERKAQYKHKTRSVEDRRNKRRQDEIDQRKARREKYLSGKRFRHSVSEDIDPQGDDIAEKQVIDATNVLLNKGPEKLKALQTLRRAFAQGTSFIDTFFGEENSLTCLVGLLTGNETELQLEAAWCITNIAAGTDDQAIAVVKAAAPYLITYLSSSNIDLKDQCAWAIGNLAGDSTECRKLLSSQGCVAPLVKLLETDTPNVVQSAAFALSNMARECKDITSEIVTAGVIPHLVSRLQDSGISTKLLSEIAWVLTYLTSSGEHTSELVAEGVLTHIVRILIEQSDEQDVTVLTPVLRCLGNICSGLDEYSIQTFEKNKIVPALITCLNSEHHHIPKETMWVLANMTGENTVCEKITKGPLLDPILKKLTGAYDIKVEALYLLCNLGCHGKETCSYLISKGVVESVTAMLKSHDVELLHLVLSFCEMSLRLTDEAKALFESSEGVARLEGLEYHTDEVTRRQANDLLETYFYIDNNEEDAEEEAATMKETT